MKGIKTLFRLTEDGIFYDDKDVQEIENNLRFHVENSPTFRKMMQRVMTLPVSIEQKEDI